jgi:hypothetical protein
MPSLACKGGHFFYINRFVKLVCRRYRFFDQKGAAGVTGLT